MTVRAKFMLISSTESRYGVQQQAPIARTLKFQPQYDTSIPEDQRFAKATPSGFIEMYVDNPAALEQFELGKQYYIDFTPAD